MKKLINRLLKFKGYWLLLTQDVRNKEDIHLYHHVVGWSLFKRNWYIRKIPIWDAMVKRISKDRVYLEVIGHKDNILYVEVKDGLISK